MKTIKVGCSPLSGNIYAGTAKDGLWETKHDVTKTAPGAVAQHLIQLDAHIEFTHNGEKKYLIVLDEYQYSLIEKKKLTDKKTAKKAVEYGG